jgi:hypothetical protein
MMASKQDLQLAPEVDIDPTQQDRGHDRSVALPWVPQQPLVGSATRESA